MLNESWCLNKIFDFIQNFNLTKQALKWKQEYEIVLAGDLILQQVELSDPQVLLDDLLQYVLHFNQWRLKKPNSIHINTEEATEDTQALNMMSTTWKQLFINSSSI